VAAVCPFANPAPALRESTFTPRNDRDAFRRALLESHRQPGPTEEFDFLKWFRAFRKLVRDDFRAERCLSELQGTSVPTDTLCLVLAFACDFPGSPTLSGLGAGRKQVFRLAKEYEKLSARLESDSKDLQSCGLELPIELTAQMMDAANRLRNAATAIRSNLSKQKLNSTFFLVWLISLVKEHTGRARFREIAFLLEAAYRAHGKEPPLITEESLRKTYARFKKNNPLAVWMTLESRKIGLIGHTLVQIFRHSGFPLLPDTRTEMDLGALLSQINDGPIRKPFSIF
jgi:hypothetical protein